MIRWINENLGTAPWGQTGEVTGVDLIDVRDLVDKGGNAPASVRVKIEQALEHLRAGKRVVICCDYGMSRSNAVAAGVLATHEGVGLEAAIRQVLKATGETAINLGVLSVVREALGENAPRNGAPKAGVRRILVTGATGSIGAVLTSRLKKSFEIVSPTHGDIDLLCDTVKLDLWVRKNEVDTILHLAHPRICTTNASLGESLLMLKNVLDVCVENQTSLVYLSCWEIYSGYEARELRASETLAPRPGGTCGQAKFLCEALIEQFERGHGLRYALLRSSPVYGLRTEKPKFIWNFLHKALRHQDVVAHKFLNGYPTLDLLHVDDLCRAIEATLVQNVFGAFNIGSGKAVSTSEVAQYLIQKMGSRSKLRYNEIQRCASNIVMDISRAHTILGWQPKVEWALGLDEIVQSVVESRETVDGNPR